MKYVIAQILEMKKIKILAAAVAISCLLALGAPAVASIQMPPAVVFVQDEKDRIMVNHNFEGDNGLLIPWDMSGDNGFWINP